MCPRADLTLKGPGIRCSTLPKNILDKQSQTFALAPLGILLNILQMDPVLICKAFSGKSTPPPRCGPRVRHEKDTRSIRFIGLSESCHNFFEADSGGSACQL